MIIQCLLTMEEANNSNDNNIDPRLPWPRDVNPPDTSHFHQDTYARSQFDVMTVLVRTFLL